MNQYDFPAIIEKEKKNILDCKKQLKSWKSRVYKQSNITVTDRHTEGDRYNNLSVNYINERRRENRIKGFTEAITSSQNIIEYYEGLIEKEERKNAPQVVYSDNSIDDLESLFL